MLGRGETYETTIPKGTTVLAMTHSGMFDPKALPHPDDFDPTRGPGNQFHFGLGLHECLGRAVGGVMIPEIVRQALRLKGLTAGRGCDAMPKARRQRGQNKSRIDISHMI